MAMVDKGPSNALAKLNAQVGSSRGTQGDRLARPGSSTHHSGFRSARPQPGVEDQSQQSHPSVVQHTAPSPQPYLLQQPSRPAPQQPYHQPHNAGAQWVQDYRSMPAASAPAAPKVASAPAAAWQLGAQQAAYRPPMHAPPVPSYHSFVPNRPAYHAATPQSHALPPSYAAPVPEASSSSLAETASLLLSGTENRSLDTDTAAKLKGSGFMALMRDFAEGRKDVLGEEVVDADVRQGWDRTREGEEGWAQDFSNLSLGDALDKGKAREVRFDDVENPYSAPMTDAQLMAATGVAGATSARWEEDMNDDQAQEAFLYYNGPARQQRPLQRPADDVLVEQAEAWDKQQGVERDARAWLEMGIRQQENEREDEAIAALKKSIALDPSLAEAYLSLAISHTNSSDPKSTFRALEAWAGRAYPAVLQRAEVLSGVGSVSREGMGAKERGEWLARALIGMVQESAGEEGRVDGNLQVALGVLFNTSGAYEQAQDCFRTALAVKPDDYQLLNRLGATLANGGKADEAYELYWRALELRPGFVRARFNLGISCMNLKRYEEAAEHVLAALRLQAADSANSESGAPSVGSATLWDTLRNACVHMKRHDLVGLCQARDLGALEGVEFAEGGPWDVQG